MVCLVASEKCLLGHLVSLDSEHSLQENGDLYKVVTTDPSGLPRTRCYSPQAIGCVKLIA